MPPIPNAPTPDFQRHPDLLDAADSVLVIVDMQEPFLNVMYKRETLIANVVLLATAARILSIPVLLTTQYAARMSGSIAEVRDAATPAMTASTSGAPPLPTFDKMVFSCMGNAEFRDALAALHRQQVVLCGLETHICVSQTAHDMAHAGYDVHVAPDAVSSRTVEKHKLGMERIRDAGIRPVCAEAAVYEWLREAGTPAFKAILPLVK